MDSILNKAKGAMSGGSSTTGTTNNTAATGNTGGQDYGDKAFAFGAKKSGHNINPSMQEKITDGARGAYEKATGSKVDPKYSN